MPTLISAFLAETKISPLKFFVRKAKWKSSNPFDTLPRPGTLESFPRKPHNKEKCKATLAVSATVQSIRGRNAITTRGEETERNAAKAFVFRNQISAICRIHRGLVYGIISVDPCHCSAAGPPA